MVVEHYVVRPDVVECCDLVARAARAVRCPQWFLRVLLETWPRRGRYAGYVVDDRGKVDWPMRKYAQRSVVALEFGGLRSGYVNDDFGRMLEAMERTFLEAVMDQVSARWGRAEGPE